MRKSLLTALAAIPALLQADSCFEYNGDKPLNGVHHFSPIGFYKKHWEGKYRYEFGGVGLRYDFKKDKGLNLGTNVISNLETKTTYVESEVYLAVKYPFESFTLYPKFVHRASSHKIVRKEQKDLHVTKATTFLGGGFSTKMDFPVNFRCEGYLFRDIANIIIVEEGTVFTGARFDNPFGLRGDLCMMINHFDIFDLEISGNYSYCFQKEYWDRGLQINFGWRF